MKLVIDMNLSVEWVPALRGAGVEAVHWTTIGPQDARDDDIMAWAQANGAVVLTRDLDFAAMLMRQGRASPSIVQMRIEQARPEHHLPLVQRALSLHRRHLEQGAIVTLRNDRMRVHLLNPDA